MFSGREPPTAGEGITRRISGIRVSHFSRAVVVKVRRFPRRSQYGISLEVVLCTINLRQGDLFGRFALVFVGEKVEFGISEWLRRVTDFREDQTSERLETRRLNEIAALSAGTSAAHVTTTAISAVLCWILCFSVTHTRLLKCSDQYKH